MIHFHNKLLPIPTASFKSTKPVSGFTVIELLVVVTIISILSAAVVSHWLAFINLQRLSDGRDQAHRAMMEAQSTAKLSKVTQEVNFREMNGQVQISIHAKDTPATAKRWKNLTSDVKIDRDNTTLLYSNSEGVWRVQFNYRGTTNGQLGSLTLMPQSGGRAKRCVIISTLLGTMRTAKERARPNSNGRYCY